MPCLSPLRIPDVAHDLRCGRCEACRSQRRNQWALRALAEASWCREHGGAVWFVTLTYRDGEDGAQEFLYSDVQRAFKRLRKAGYQFRYFVVGERGTRSTQRCHWHVLFFWQGEPPPRGERLGRPDSWIDQRKARYHWRSEVSDFWPHGHVNIQDVKLGEDCRPLHYLMGYVGKADSQRPRMSTKPAIGVRFFFRLAWECAVGNRVMGNGRNWFTISGYSQSLPPRWWRRVQTHYMDVYEEAHRRRPDVDKLGPHWTEAMSTRDREYLNACRFPPPLLYADRYVPVNFPSIRAHGKLCVTPRGIVLWVDPDRRDANWLGPDYEQRQQRQGGEPSDPEQPGYLPGSNPFIKRVRSDGSSNGSSRSRARWLPSGAFVLERPQVKQCLRGEVPELTDVQIARGLWSLPRASCDWDVMRLRAAQGQGSLGAPSSAILLSDKGFFVSARDAQHWRRL